MLRKHLTQFMKRCRVFLEYAKIDQAKERLCWQVGLLFPSQVGGVGGGVGWGSTLLNKTYNYVPPQKLWVLRHFGLKRGIHFAHFGLESSIVFQ